MSKSKKKIYMPINLNNNIQVNWLDTHTHRYTGRQYHHRQIILLPLMKPINNIVFSVVKIDESKQKNKKSTMMKWESKEAFLSIWLLWKSITVWDAAAIATTTTIIIIIVVYQNDRERLVWSKQERKKGVSDHDFFFARLTITNIYTKKYMK